MKACVKKKPEIQKMLGASARVLPRAEEFEPLAAGRRPTGRSGLRLGYANARPHRGHLADRHRRAHRLELAAHHDEPLDRALDLVQALLHHVGQPVEAQQLLREHRVHRLLVLDGEVDERLLDVVLRAASARSMSAGELADDLLVRLALAARRARLERERGAEQLVRLGERARDVRVVVQPEHLGPLVVRQPAHVLHVVAIWPSRAARSRCPRPRTCSSRPGWRVSRSRRALTCRQRRSLSSVTRPP